MFLTGVLLAKPDAAYVFTSTDGRTLEAKIIAVSDSTVTIRRISDGRKFELGINRLIPEDAVYIREWSEHSRMAEDGPASESEAIGRWPRKLKPDNYDIEIVCEDNRADVYIYRTPHFEFHSNVKLARKVVREFSQIFESTLLAVQELPLKLSPEVPRETFYLTEIFETEAQYLSAGGIPNSAGVYFSGSRKIMVPLKNLGVKKSSSSYTIDEGADRTTLAHEITHQVTHDWLEKLPVWVAEGIAEYIEHVPYERGAFRFDQYDAEEVMRSGYTRLARLETLMNMHQNEWNYILSDNRQAASANYLTAYMLCYYFCHFDLDEEDNPRRFYDYLRAIEMGESQEAAVRILLNGRSYEELEEAVKRSYKREDVEVGFL